MRAKRSRTASTASDASSSSAQQPVKKLTKQNSVSEEVVHRGKSVKSGCSSSTVASRENEANLEPRKDVEKFRSACQTIQTLFEEMKSLKDEDVATEATDSQIESLRIQCLLSFVVLKRCNHATQLCNKKARDQTNEAKQEVDNLHLQLQNLLYEIMHLKKEINKCLQFKSKDEEIDLVSEEEFLKEKANENNEELADSHKRMLARLDWELKERVRLTSKEQDYVNLKRKISQEIETKNDFLNSLEPQLKSILKATLPIQEFMDVQLDSQRLQYQAAKYLARPLYILFVQSMAYQEACDPHLEVVVIGDVEAAKAVLEAKPGVVEVDFDEKNEKNEEDEPEEQPKKRHHRRTTEELCGEEKIKATLKKHPLQVELTLLCNDDVRCILLFSYIQSLNIVTVTVKLQFLKQEEVQPVFSGRSLLSPDSVLICLYPEDFGDVTPNPANHYQLSKLGIKDIAFHKLNVGHPYHWVQKICGLDFPALDSNTHEAATVKPSISASHMERTVQAIKARVLTRISLQSQLQSLESLNIQLSDEGRLFFPTKTLSKLEKWTPVTLSEFSDLPFVDYSTCLDNVTENDMLFIATFSNNTVELKAAVIVLSDYPARPPLFTLAIFRNGKYMRNDHVKAIETEVNVFYKELFEGDCRDNVLSNQLSRLQMCFDIFNDASNSTNEDLHNHEFLMLRTKRGRDRALALQFDRNLGCFTHRCR